VLSSVAWPNTWRGLMIPIVVSNSLFSKLSSWITLFRESSNVHKWMVVILCWWLKKNVLLVYVNFFWQVLVVYTNLITHFIIVRQRAMENLDAFLKILIYNYNIGRYTHYHEGTCWGTLNAQSFLIMWIPNIL
jgi:hypothetical protein